MGATMKIDCDCWYQYEGRDLFQLGAMRVLL